MDLNNRKNFLLELIDKVKISIETEKKIDKLLADAKTKEMSN